MMTVAGYRGLSGMARELNVNESTLRNAIHTGRIRLADFLRIAELCGFQVVARNGKGESPE